MANGALSTLPMGALMQQDQGIDPKTLALLQMGLAGMAASGPSRTPTSLGQIMGQSGMAGLQAYQQGIQGQQQQAFRQAQMQKMEEELALRRAEADRKANAPIVAGPGTQFLHPVTREVMHSVPFKPDAPQPVRPPMTRTVQRGTDKVTEEYVDGSWREVGRGPAFQKLVETPGGPKPAALPKPPTGYRYKADSDELEPIPGGPKDTAPKDAARAAGAIQKADTVIQKVDEALGLVGPSTTGLLGDLRSTTLGRITGSGAFDLEKTIDTIKANLGFSELQAMREASPTGGALGQVAVQELAMLQSTIASLDKGQSADVVKKNLEQVRTHFQNWKKAVQDAQQQQPGAAPSNTPTQFPQPPAEAVRRLKMNPKEREQFDAIFGPGAAAKALGR
jgi:hypothetical protein